MVQKPQVRDRGGAAALFSRHRAAALSLLYVLPVALFTGRAFGQGTQISGGQMRIVTNPQTGVSYTMTASDCGKLLSLSNSGTVVVTIPQAGATGLPSGCWVDIQNAGSGPANFTATSSLIDGAAGFTLTTNQGLRLFSNGAGYFTQRGQGGAGGASLAVENNGTTQTVRPNLNLIGGANATVVCTDNSGASRTDCTLSAAGTAVTVSSNGTPVGSPRQTINFVSGAGIANAVTDTGSAINVSQGTDSTIPTKSSLQSGAATTVTVTGSNPTTYVGSVTPALATYTGAVLTWTPGTGCTPGPVTININGLGAVPVVEASGATNPVAADCAATNIDTIAFDGTRFRIIAGGASLINATGGTGAIQSNNGTGGLQATSITDNGTSVTTFEPLSAGGFTSTANVQGTLSLPYAANVSAPVANAWGWMSQNPITTPWYGCAPNAGPSPNQVMLFPAPTTDSGGKAVSCWAWTGFTSTNLTDTSNIAYLTATQTFTGKTFDTAGSGNVLKVNGSVLTGVQGNTANVQLAGINSGASGAGLCNDASGNTTTSGCSSGGSSSPANYSCGGVSNTMTGSDITMCSFSGVSLAAGACLTFQGMVEAAQNYVLKINAGTTTISIPVGSNNAWAGYYVSWATMYCNNPGVQSAQTLNPLWGFYQATYGYGIQPTSFFSEDPLSGGTYPWTPAAVNWAGSQTLSVTMNAASGTGTVLAFRAY
jgi:hypothetical protein